MKICADLARCEGHNMCVSLMPDVFGVTDDGKVALLTENVRADQLPDTQLAVGSCPVQALRLEN